MMLKEEGPITGMLKDTWVLRPQPQTSSDTGVTKTEFKRTYNYVHENIP